MITVNACRAYNYRGFDRRGQLRKGKRFEAEAPTPREAARLCLEQMRAGKSRSDKICVDAGERKGPMFSTAIGIGGTGGGTPSWRIEASEEGVNTLPESL